MDTKELIARVRKIHNEIRDTVCEHMQTEPLEGMSAVVAETAGDTIYAVDRVSEDGLRVLFEREFAGYASFILIGEGLNEAGEVFPHGTRRKDAQYRVIVDPIDGTRGLMYDKRSAWILTGIAHNRGEETHLGDIFAAVQTEIPTSKQFRADTLWAIEGDGWGAEGYNRLTGETAPVSLTPSQAETIEHGFGMISRFFPGGKALLAQIEEDLVERLIGKVIPGKARLFEDQYISTGGQLYEMLAGHDRFNADLRPLLDVRLVREGNPLGICCHPYDICTALIAQEAGISVAKPDATSLSAPLDTTSPVAWVAYANAKLQASIQPVLEEVLESHGLL